jgi:hypothetical protein
VLLVEVEEDSSAANGSFRRLTTLRIAEIHCSQNGIA